jgi:hypothetical protein
MIVIIYFLETHGKFDKRFTRQIYFFVNLSGCRMLDKRGRLLVAMNIAICMEYLHEKKNSTLTWRATICLWTLENLDAPSARYKSA